MDEVPFHHTPKDQVEEVDQVIDARHHYTGCVFVVDSLQERGVPAKVAHCSLVLVDAFRSQEEAAGILEEEAHSHDIDVVAVDLEIDCIARD